MNRPGDFSYSTKDKALMRQHHRCALCGTHLPGLGNAAKEEHDYGEGNHAHHVDPLKLGGTNDVSNCVIICQSCHYSVHEGGNYRYGTVGGYPKDYPHYNG